MADTDNKKDLNRTAETSGSVSFFPGSTPEEKFFRKWLFFISIAALILRSIASFEMACAGGGINNMLEPLKTSDLATYMRLGKEIAQGKFPETFYYQPFYYAVFLPVINLIFGKLSTLGVIICQILLSSATVYLAGMCGAKIFNRRAGIITALCCAISSPLILYVPFHQNETVHCYLLTLLLFLTLRAIELQRLRDWCFAGLAAGVAILNRGNINLLIPVLIAAIAAGCRRERFYTGEFFRKTGCLLGCAIVLQLPFVVYNSAALKRFSGPSTAANAVLALGNTVEAPAGGREPGTAPGAMYYPEAYHRAMKRATGSYPESMAQQMWEFFCREPLAFCELQFRKALLFWDGREIPNNVAIEHDGATSLVLRWGLPGRSHVLLTVSLFGLFWFIPRLKKREVKLWVLYGFVIFFWGAVTVFYMLSRFRAPILPALFIFAGAGIDNGWDELKKVSGRARRLLAGKMMIVLLISFGFVFSFYDTYRFYLEAPLNRMFRPDGIKLDNGGADIQVFDHGPAPFGGWTLSKANPGMTLYKRFAHCGNEGGNFYFFVHNTTASKLEFTVNGVFYSLEFPELQPGKSSRKRAMVPAALVAGALQIEVLNCSGDISFIFDVQRDYGRSGLNGEILPAEWVFRFGKMR